MCLVAFMTLSQAFDPGPAPGLKIRNALVYLLVLGLLSRFTIDRSYRIQAPVIPAVFGLLIGYAILTYVGVLLVLDYPHYDAIKIGMSLKTALIDQLLLFLVFFYGCRSNEDALLILKVLTRWACCRSATSACARMGEYRERSASRINTAHSLPCRCPRWSPCSRTRDMCGGCSGCSPRLPVQLR
jgi:hypothetical protein